MSSNPEHPQTDTFSFREKHSPNIRLWHWLLFLVVTALLITVLINSTILSRDTAVPVISQSLQKNGIVVNVEQARKVGGSLRNIVWTLHGYIGLGLAALFLYRIVLEFLEPGQQKLVFRIKKGLRLLKNERLTKARGGNYLFAKFSYLIFYLMLLVAVSTGLTLFFVDNIGISRKIEHTIKEVHQFDMYLIIAFILLHLTGVIKSELGKDKGIVSDMINGGE